MTEITPLPSKPTHIYVAQYLALIESGVLAENDRVELLEGVIVSMAPSDPLRATSVTKTTLALIRVSQIARRCGRSAISSPATGPYPSQTSQW